MKLFSEYLGTANSAAEVQKIQANYPNYDKAFVCMSVASDRTEVKDWLELQWDSYHPFADSNFEKEVKTQFAQRTWELHLAAVIRERGLTLAKTYGTGPDLDVRESKSGTRLTWIEAIAVEKGNGADRVPDMVLNNVGRYPERQMLLRLTSALREKQVKCEKYFKKSIVDQSDRYVIAVNSAKLEHPDPEMPLILKVLFGIGHFTIMLDKSGKRRPDNENHWQYRPEVSKATGANVTSEFFLNSENAGISAVLYCNYDVLNSVKNGAVPGSDFVLVHNPFARNPLPYGALPCGEEWRYDMHNSTAHRFNRHDKPQSILEPASN